MRVSPLALLLLAGLRALDDRPADPAAVTESFVLKLLSLSGFHPALTACAVCGSADVRLWSSASGGAVCAMCAEGGSQPVTPEALALLAHLAGSDLGAVGRSVVADGRLRREARGLLFGFAEYHLERRMRSVPMLVMTAT